MVNVFVSKDPALNALRPVICFCDENNHLSELYFDESLSGLANNGIYVGQVYEKIKTLNALRVSFGELGEAFCNCQKEAFDAVQCGRSYAFQVKRLAFTDRKTKVQKKPEVSLEWEIASPNIILTSQCGQIGISANITNPDKRTDLRAFAKSLHLNDLGLIFRTSSAELSHDDLRKELENLTPQVDCLHEDNFNAYPMGKCLYQSKPFWKERLLFLQSDRQLGKVLFDDDSLKSMLSEFGGEKYVASKLHMLDFFRISPQIEDAFKNRLDLKNGGYVLFEQTNAFYAVDVNSSLHFSGKNREESLLKVNLEACELIMQQIRLRNIAGGIVIDFINMTDPKHIQILKERAEELARLDPVHVSVYDFTRLFHLELARAHQGLSLKENMV